MYIPERSIIDNDKLKLCDELNKILKEQKIIDIASGYFMSKSLIDSDYAIQS